MTISIKTSTRSSTARHKQSSMPSAPDAAIVPVRPIALAPQLMPLLDLLADLIARDVLAQRRESHPGLGSEETTPVTTAETLSSPTRDGGTSRSHSQIPTNFSSTMPLQSLRHPHVDEPVITEEKKR